MWTQAITDYRRGRVWRLCLCAVMVRLAFVFVTPAWQAPDEYAHFWVAEQIALTGAHPAADNTFPNYEAYQPPLYYWVVAPVLLLFDATVSFSTQPVPPPSPLIALRLLSVLFFVVTFGLAWRLLKRFERLEEGERLWSLAFISFLPTFVSNGASVTNDGLVVLLSVACCLVIWKTVWSGRTPFYGGLLAGLALLAKWNAVILIPLIAWRIWQTAGGDKKRFLRWALTAAAGWLLPAALLLGRNLVQYGDPVALSPGAVRGFGLTLGNLLRAIRNLTWSFWLAFGADYKTTPGPGVYLVTAFPLMLAAVVGWWRTPSSRSDLLKASLVSLAVGVTASLGFTMSYPPGEATSWGKNLFVILPFAAMASVIGWTQLGGRRPWLIPSLATVLMLAGCTWGLWRLGSMSAG